MASQHPAFPERMACMLQIGYFKAKHVFFHFRLTDIPAQDIQFLALVQSLYVDDATSGFQNFESGGQHGIPKFRHCG
jgi:hypothetical protein